MSDAHDADHLWFHLGSKEIEQDFITDVRMPDFKYLDVDEPCFSVAPTVWQCAIAISQPGTSHIHTVNVRSPESAQHDTADGNVTQEHRITTRVLEANEGTIPIHCIGYVEISRDVLVQLKIAFHAKQLACNAEKEREFLWKVTGKHWTWRGLSIRQLENELSRRPE